MVPSRFYIALIGFFMAALVFGLLFFLTSMGENSYVVSDGFKYGLRYIDKPKYDMNMQGVIFTLTFLAAGILMIILMILPGQQPALSQAAPPPQPRRRPGEPQPQAAPQPAAQTAAPQPAGQTATAQPRPEGESSQTMVEIEDEGRRGQSGRPSERAAQKKVSVEEELLQGENPEDMIEDIPDTRGDLSGEEDVVYGSGRVNDDSIWEFIHDYPDSAVKFLYRKTLENKPLSPNEEDIYRRWEMRGMTRTKVRSLMLEIMGWDSLPDEFPHNIWKYLRDQIFELKSRA